MRNEIRRTVVPAFAFLVVTLLPASLPRFALAQQSVERVEITGSSIRRVDAETAVPVQVIQREEIEKSGATNVETFLQGLGVALQGNNNTVAATASGATTGGVSGVSLRGLGSQRTLVLIDGRRVSSGGTLTDATTVDVNMIPVAAIERIEVLRDGASAIYGSDAIAGVINFILRKDYKGAEVSVFANKTQRPHGGGEGMNAVLGWGDFAERRFNATLIFDAKHDDALFGHDRGFSNTGAGINLATRNDTTSGNTFPANVTDDPLGGANRNPSYPACPGPYAINSPLRPGSCRFDPSGLVTLLPKTDQFSVFGNLRLNLARQMEGYAQASYVYKEQNFVIQPVPISDQFQLPPNHPLFFTSPYFIPAANGGFSTFLLRPSSPFYPTAFATSTFGGTPDLYVRYRSAATGNRDLTDISDQKRLVLGVRGTAQRWDYDAAFLHIDTNLREHVNNGYPALTKILPLLNSGQVNPFGPNTPAVQAQLDATQFHGDAWKTKTSIDSGAAKVSRDLMPMAGGPLAMAIGTELRREGFKLNTSDEIASGDISGYGGNFLPTDKSRNVYVAFTEVSMPVVKSVELIGAARYDKYQDVGSKISPKLGARWQPIRQVVVRGSVSRGFRAPSLTDLYQPQTTGVSAPGIDDPLRCPLTASSTDCGTQFPIVIGGNTGLKPEISTNATAGVVFEPVTNLSVGVDYWQIRLQNTIIYGVAADQILTDPLSANTFGFLVTRAAPDTTGPCAGVCPGRIISIDQRNLNLGETHIKGFDTDIRYRFPTTARGVFSVGLQGTYYYRYDQQNLLDASFTSINGKVTGINNGVGGVIPRWRHYLTADWRLAPWTFSVAQQYQSGYEDLAGNRPPNPSHSVGAYSLFHVYGSYQGLLNKNFRLTLGIRNLFDKDPPFTNAGGRNYFQGGYDPGYADPRGRTFLIQGTYKFI